MAGNATNCKATSGKMDNYDGSKSWLPNPVSVDEMAVWPGLPKLEALRLEGPAVAWITQLFTDKYCPALESIACEIQLDCEV